MDYHYTTAGPKTTQKTKFAIGGDVGSTGEKITRLFRAAASKDPFFIVIGGDLAYANGVETEKWRGFLSLWRENMIAPGNRIIPLFACIGNHEVIGGFTRSRDNSPLLIRFLPRPSKKLTIKPLMSETRSALFFC